MLVDVEFLTKAGDFQPKTHRRTVLGTAAQIGSYVADVLLDDYPMQAGDAPRVTNMKLTFSEDPEAL